MSQQQPAGENVRSMEQLSVYHKGGNGYWVVNGDTAKLYEVDLTYPPTCGCEDFQYNQKEDRADVCKHIEKVVLVGPSVQTAETQVFSNLAQLVSEAETAVSDIKDVRDMAQTAQRADARATAKKARETEESDVDSENYGGEDTDLEAVKQVAKDMGVPVGSGVEIYRDEDLGSIQIESEYLDEQSQFEALQAFTDLDGVWYDGDEDRNYITEENIATVIE